MSVFTPANQLTLLRMFLIPVFVLCMLYGWPGWALVTFVVAGLTDALDGFLARRTGQQTTLGAWLDPVADKLLVAAMFVMLTLPGIGLAVRLPLWLTVCVLSRDIAIVVTVAIVNLAVGPRTFKPSPLGKLATVVYIITGVVALYANYLREPLPIVTACVYVALAVTLASAGHYAVMGSRRVPAPRSEAARPPS